MKPELIIAVIAAYFLVLILISYFTGKNDDNQTFFLGNKQSPWYVVAFGMIGASLSGVTFISVPGLVEGSQFAYMQMVLGYLLGYLVIGTVLLPLYYRLNLTSIYTYLDTRFGKNSYKTGSAFFLLSRTVGAAFRLYLVANVMQLVIFDALKVPFVVTVIITILLIWLYTFRSGIKTIIWTDTLQTFFMLLAVGVSIWLISDKMGLSFEGIKEMMSNETYTKTFFFEDWKDKRFFFKQFFAGAFIAIAMTGLDQDMMQKNLSCKNIKEAQKNMFWMSTSLVVVNFFFLMLGVLLYNYANTIGITAIGDDLFPAVAMNGGLGVAVAIFFILGLIAAAYSSADSALTSLTTAFSVDFLNIQEKENKKRVKIRKITHIAFSLLLMLVILSFHYLIKEKSIISKVFQAAGYTYGPLLGLFSFGLFTKINIRDKYVPLIAILSPIFCYLLNIYSDKWFGFKFGFELLIINGAITFIGLLILKTSGKMKTGALDEEQ